MLPPIKGTKKSYIETILLRAEPDYIKSRLHALTEQEERERESRPSVMKKELKDKLE